MNYNIIIDILDNNALSNDIGTKLYTRLRNNNFPTILLDDNISVNEKISRINQYGSDTIVISNQMNNADTSEIIYSLYYDNTLPNLINDNLSDILNISKFYQLRLPSDTSKDYYEIIRETPNAESIIIRYQNNIQNQINNIVDNLYNTITNYVLRKNTYVVQSGDTLYSIARKFGITPNDIIKANNLSNTNLSINQELIIPSLSNKNNGSNNNNDNNNNNYQQYIVKSGDSLYKIASNFNTTINKIKELNNLTTNNLSIGQTLLIPKQQEETTYQQYIVKSGDSLYKIANNFNTTVNQIKELNNLTTNTLSIGQIILIPKQQEETTYQQYTVKSGDSLYKIANNFNTTINDIIKLNDLATTTLSIGQVLLIPKSQEISYQQYTIKQGDSLYKIANTFNTTVNEIISLNNLSSTNLSIGQILLIPN